MKEIFIFSFFFLKSNCIYVLCNHQKKMLSSLYIKITKVLNWKNYAMNFLERVERMTYFIKLNKKVISFSCRLCCGDLIGLAVVNLPPLTHVYI